MYRCPFMDQNKYMEEDYVYDEDMNCPQNMYSPDFYRMCPMFLNARNAYMRCMYPINYMQSAAQTYPYYDDPEEKTEYVPFDENNEDFEEEKEQEERKQEEKKEFDKQDRIIDGSYGDTRIRTVDISDIQD